MGRTILMDGAAGTTLWEIAEKNGAKKDPVWIYNIEHPEFVRELHDRYIAAGSEIIQANTFGANGPSVKRSSSYETADVVRAAVRIAKEAVEASGKDVKVALSVGPLSQLMEPYGDLEEEEVEEIYDEMFAAGVPEGADYIIIETFFDLAMMAVAARTAKKYGVPVLCSMTFEKVGKTMMGNSVQDVIDELTAVGVDGIGMNCSLGPETALAIIREFAEKTDLPIFYKPNAGLPISSAGGTDAVPYTPESFAKEVAPAVEFVSYLGGCCGTNDEFVKELKKLL